jgi:purine-binding chemotaxis protein CheW
MSPPSGKYVSFTLGGADYCVAVDSVRQVLRQENILDTPMAHPFVKGVISLRGDVIPVVDLRARLGLPAETAWRKRRIIVVDYGRSSYGLLVDEVRDIVELDDEKKGPHSDLVLAIGRSAERRFLILDLAGVFSADKGITGKAERASEAAAGKDEWL